MNPSISKRAPRVMILVEGGRPLGHSDLSAWDGPKRYWLPAIEKLRTSGFEIVFGTLRNRSPLHPMVEKLGCETFTLEAGGAPTYPIAALRLRRLLRRYRIDVLHASESIQAAVGGIAAFALGTRTVNHRHHTLSEPAAYLLLSRMAGRLADITMTVSLAAAEGARKEGVPVSRIRVASNGIPPLRLVDPVEVTALKDQLLIGDNDQTIVAVGNLRIEKGHRYLLDAFETLKVSTGRVHLIVVGTGPEESDLRTIAGQLRSSDRTHFVGAQGDVALWYGLADVVVVPSLRESFGLVAVEAMSLGRPVVGCAVEGLAEVIESGESGLLVAPRDVEGLAGALQQILESPQLSERLSSGGVDRYRCNYTLDSMIASWSSCYQELLPEHV